MAGSYDGELYGESVYERIGSTEDPISGGADGGHSPLLRNWQTGETFFLRRVNLENRWVKNAYFRRILEPPRTERIFWPVDLLPLPDELRAECTLFVDHEYVPIHTPPEQRKGEYAVALPMPKDKKRTSGTERLARLKKNWKDEKTRNVAVQLTEAVADVNREGYLYHDFHPSRICFGDKERLFLDYSNLACSYGERIEEADAFLRKPEKNTYPLEFAAPGIIQGQNATLSFRSQNYSLCAFLFYLLIGRYAYDGALLAGYPDDNPYNHDVKFRDYHKLPIFIFDPDNTSNAVGAFEEDKAVVRLWEECPEELRGWFVHTLCLRPNGLEEATDYPTAENWLALFRRLGWSK